MTTTHPRSEPEGVLAPKTRVLVADDEESMRFSVRRGLERRGYEVVAVGDGAAAKDELARGRFDAAVLDLKMPEADGIEVLEAARASGGEAVVVLMTAHATVQTAVQALRLGADDYVLKPFELDELVVALERGLETRALRRENRALRAQLDGGDDGFCGMVGRSDAMRGVFEQIERMAQATGHVLLGGESGTGKELAARAIHLRSPRASGPFVIVPCALLPTDLVESELFGHEAGAFTGAETRRLGLLRRADGGTVLFDEIAQLPESAQAKIERFLETRTFTPLGGNEPVTVDVRVLAATDRPLARLVEDHAFRRELFFRLDVLRLDLPPLRERREDVPLLFVEWLRRACPGAPPQVPADVEAALVAYDWPGNVRELRNLAERLAVLTAGRDVLALDDLPDALRGKASGRGPSAPDLQPNYEQAKERFEFDYFKNLLERTGGNVAETARRAGMSRPALHRRLAALELDPDAFRS
jgi:two-component system response regulator AtoC